MAGKPTFTDLETGECLQSTWLAQFCAACLCSAAYMGCFVLAFRVNWAPLGFFGGILIGGAARFSSRETSLADALVGCRLGWTAWALGLLASSAGAMMCLNQWEKATCGATIGISAGLVLGVLFAYCMSVPPVFRLAHHAIARWQHARRQAKTNAGSHP